MGGLLSYSLTVSVIILVLYPVLYQIINRNRYFLFNRIVSPPRYRLRRLQ